MVIFIINIYLRLCHYNRLQFKVNWSPAIVQTALDSAIWNTVINFDDNIHHCWHRRDRNTKKSQVFSKRKTPTLSTFLLAVSRPLSTTSFPKWHVVLVFTTSKIIQQIQQFEFSSRRFSLDILQLFHLMYTEFSTTTLFSIYHHNRS